MTVMRLTQRQPLTVGGARPKLHALLSRKGGALDRPPYVRLYIRRVGVPQFAAKLITEVHELDGRAFFSLDGARREGDQ
jgi:hypothetical protein